MRVIKDKDGGIVGRVLLLDDGGEPVVPVVRYLGHLIDAGYSPHTACAYGYDLRYLFEFLGAEGVSWQAFGPSTALIFLGHLRRRPTRRPAQRLGLAVATGEGRLLAPATVQRVLAATSSFYEWAIAAGEYAEPENPLRREIDPALARVPERHQPFVGTAHRPLPARRAHERLVPLGNSGQRGVDLPAQRVLRLGVLPGGDRPLVEARRRRQHPLHRRRRQQPPLASGHRQPQPLRGTPRWTTPQMTQEDQRSRGPERLPAHTLGAQELKQVSQVVAVRACRVRAVPSVDQMTEVPDDRHDGLTPVIKQQHPPNDAAVLVLDDAHPGSSPPAPTRSGGQPPAGEANVAACPDNRELRQGGEDRVPLRSVAPTRQVGTLASSTSVGGGLEGGQGPSSSVGSCPGPALDHVRVPAPW